MDTQQTTSPDDRETWLTGWPFDDRPSATEAEMIELAYHEISLHQPELSDQRRWHVAGNIVARFRRDVKQSSTSAVMNEYDTYIAFITEQGWKRDDVSCDLENSIRATLRVGETPNVSEAFRASDGRIYGRWN